MAIFLPNSVESAHIFPSLHHDLPAQLGDKVSPVEFSGVPSTGSAGRWSFRIFFSIKDIYIYILYV